VRMMLHCLITGNELWTFLGQVFASMFPHRVGALCSNGVLDPDEISKESG